MAPVPPPSPRFLVKALGPQRFADLIMAAGEVTSPSDPYLPWDQLRYRKPPRDFTHEQWWLAVKYARSTMRRVLPLTMVDGRPFSYTLPDDVLRLIDEIRRRASGQEAAPEQVTDPTTRNRYFINSLMEEAITSSQLEGASTSRRVAMDMITSGRSPRDRSERMIVNNYNAMQFVVAHKGDELTPDLLCELHRIVTADTLRDPAMAGSLQTSPDPNDRVKVYGGKLNQVVHNPPPVDQLPARLAALCAFANGTDSAGEYVPAVLRPLILHFMVGYDHYFVDGNGRTARAVFYWSMLKHGYWLTEYASVSRLLRKAPAQYGRSFVLCEQDDGDLTYFLLYHLGILKRAFNDLADYLTRKSAELAAARRILAAKGNFNPRQLAVIESARKTPDTLYTVHTHMTTHGVSHQTARNDLTDLENRGLLIRTKKGHSYAWIPESGASGGRQDRAGLRQARVAGRFGRTRPV